MDGYTQGVAVLLSNYRQKYTFFTCDMTLTNSTEADA